MSDKLQENPLERKTSDTLKRKKWSINNTFKNGAFLCKTDDFSLYLTFLQHKHAICVSWWSNVRPYTNTSIAATVLYFFCLQITIARAYISKSIHVAFRNESSLNIYVHICFLNENCYGKSRAECEKSRSSQPYFPNNTKISLSSVRQWERIEQIDIENVRFSMHVSKFDCIRFVVVRRLLLFCSRVTSFFFSSSRLLSHSLHAKQ